MSRPVLFACITFCLIMVSACSSSGDDDRDDDGIVDAIDNCPSAYNPDQASIVGNVVLAGDMCDDEDVDTFVDVFDNCPLVSNTNQLDTDGNGIGDACDSCEPLSLAADVWRGAGSALPDNLTVMDNKLYFQANDGVLGEELWVLDPARPADGAMLVTDIVAGSGGSRPSSLSTWNNRLYFGADDGMHGYEPWVYDPATGARLLVDLNPGADSGRFSLILALDNEVYLAYLQAWVFDTTDLAAEAQLLADFTYSPFRSILIVEGKLYLTREWAPEGHELWVYDPASPGAGLNLDSVIVPGSVTSELELPVALDGKLYFGASDGVLGHELWVYDPAEPQAGYTLIADIAAGRNSSNVENMTVLDGKLYFAANDQVHGRELWVYDPVSTGAGASLVADIVLGDNSSNPEYLVADDGKLFFHADQPGQLWVYDPSNSIDSARLESEFSVLNSIIWQQMVALDGKLFFPADDLVHGRELWVYDPGCSR